MAGSTLVSQSQDPRELEDGEVIWNVEAGIKEPISRITSPEFSEKMIRLAAEHSSEYDGWGTSVER